MDRPSPEMKYEKMSGFATTKGQMYEAKVSALLFLRGINSGIDFQLASNVKGAGALDDIVFRFKGQSDEWTSYFIQLKHKEKSWIKREMLVNNPKGEFSLKKYCKSYEDIKTAMSVTKRQVLFDGNIENSFLVIFTNAKPNSDLGEGCRASEQIDEFLGSDSGKVFSYDPDGVTEAEKAISDSLQDCVDCGRDFLKRLRIFAAQPSEDKFDNLIKKELEKSSSNFNDIDIDRLFVCFIDNVKTWCEEKRNVLDRGSDIFVSARDRVLAETFSFLEVKANKLDLVFQEDTLLPLRKVLSGEFPVVHIGSSEQSLRLTCTKLLQTFESSTYLFLGSKSFLANQSAVISEWGTGRHKTLIVSVNNRDSVTDKSHMEKIVELCKITDYPKKRLIILSDSKIDTESGLPYLKDTFEFSSLTSKSCNEFLNTTFILQGHLISLEMFFTSCCDNDILSGSFVVKIIESGPKMSVGSVLTGPNKHYLPRSLQPPQANVLKSLFQVETLPETIAILNSTTTDIVKIFLQNDASIKKHLRKSFLFSGSLLPDKNNETIFIGDTFAVGKFECNYVGVSNDKSCALRIRPLKDGHPLTACWFIFVFQGTSKSEVDKLAEVHQTRHFLSMKNEELTLLKSLDDSDFIREHIKLLRSKNLLEVKDRVVIICGEPGMGKTTLMMYLSQMAKEVHPYLWVILISLNDHTHLFAEGKHENAVEFLLAAAEIKSPFERSMLKVALEVTGNVIVMLDGYDEIAPRYTEHCCQMLSSLLKTKAKKVWVTTRISVKSELESHLEMSATILCKFNDDDQRNYLKQYWSDARNLALASGKTVLPDDELDEFINKLLKITTQSISDWGNNFLGIPLQANIMAEVFADHVTSPLKISALPEKLDLLQLLDRFIEKKLEVYIQEKLKIKPSDTNYEMHVNNIRTAYLSNHMAAAIRLILFEEYGNDLQSKKLIGDLSDFFENIKIGEEKTGFIDSIVNGKAHFVHRVFAEWFVAKWFASNLVEYGKFIGKESYHAYAGGYTLSRFLCDLILAKDCELHTAVLYGDVNKVKEMLAAGSDVNARDLGGRTPLHLTAAFGHMDSSQSRHVEILDLLIQSPGIDFEITDELVNGTPLRYADMTEYWLMIEKLLAQNVNTKCLTETLQQSNSVVFCNNNYKINVEMNFSSYNTVNLIEFILTHDQVKLLEFFLSIFPDFHNKPINTFMKLTFKGCGLLAHACQHGSLQIVTLLIERGYNINGQTQSLYGSHYPPLHCASLGGHLEIVKLLINASKREKTRGLLLVTKESHPEGFECFSYTRGPGFLESLYYVEPDFVNRKSVKGHTALHLASYNGYADVVAFLIDHGADIESRSENCCTCLHYAAQTNRTDVLNVILNAVSRQNILAFVNLSNSMQSTSLHLAANAGFIESVQILVSAGGKMTTDRYEQTPLMLAARNGHLAVVEYLLAALDEDEKGISFCNSVSRIEWLNKNDKDGWTALTLAASFGFEHVVVLLTDWGADTRRRDGLDTGLPKNYQDEEQHYNSSNLFYVDFLNNHGGTGSAAIVSVDFDGLGNTLLHTAASRGYLQVVDILFKLGAKVTKTNNAGNTTLMMAAENGYFYVVEYLLNTFDKTKPIAEYKNALNGDMVAKDLSKVEFINVKDYNGATAVCYAFFRGHKSTVDLLVRHGADVDILSHFGGQLRASLETFRAPTFRVGIKQRKKGLFKKVRF